MKAIIAVNSLGYVGLNNGLPWDLKNDLKHFRTLTLKSDKNEIPKLLVGYNTLLGLPTLKGRELVLSSEPFKVEEIDWCIGGKKTYEKYCQYFTELHISYIDDTTIGDTLYPNLDKINKDCQIFHYHF